MSAYTPTQTTVRLKAFLWLFLLLPVAALAQVSKASPPSGTQADDQTPGIPKFYAHSRQVLLEAEVWETAPKKGETPWLGDEPLPKNMRKDLLKGLPSPVRGLQPKDFQVFDNGVEQTLNYFKEAEVPAFDATNHWWFTPRTDGTWGTLDSGPHFGPSSATYVIGYIPRELRSGECHELRVIVEGRHVEVSRKQYCPATDGSNSQGTNTARAAALDTQMRAFADSSKRSAVDVSLHAWSFWSSGVLALAKEAAGSGDLVADDYTYVVEVHDSRAPATVHFAIGFTGLPLGWNFPCHKDDPEIHVLGIVHKANGEPAGQFDESYGCLTSDYDPFFDKWFPSSGVLTPSRFDGQLELRPGDYKVTVVVTDETKFGRAQLPLHIEALDPNRLLISEVVVAGIVRYAGWVLREATSVTPAPIVPSPLVSRNAEYFPDSTSLPTLKKHSPLYLYFEVYEPQSETQRNAVYYRWRITEQKKGLVVMSSDPLSAADWMMPGNAVIPIGLTLDTLKLKKGDYKLEVQATDSAGHESEWRSAKFKIQ